MTSPAVHTATHEAHERQLAARGLLATPLVTTATDPELLHLVRRHAAALKADFARQLGYPLVVEASFARLVKAPLPPSSPARALSRAGTTALGPAGYANLALVCAALGAPGVGEQILVSALVDQVRRDAVSAGVELTDSLADRRNLVSAVLILIEWGVLMQEDGSVTAWGERRQDEALLTVNRALLPHLLAQPLYVHDRPEDTWRTTDVPVRRRLRRRLIEDPVVARTELDEEERDRLSRDGADLIRHIDELTGLVVEVRAEGALAYDPRGGLSDIEFPGSGTVKQAALLLLDEFAGRGNPGDTVRRPDGTTTTGLRIVHTELDTIIAELISRFRSAWSGTYVDSPYALREAAVELLVSLGLAEHLPDGVVLRAAIARYRPVATRVPRQPGLFEDNS